MRKYKTVIICAAALASLSLLSLTACGSGEAPAVSSSVSSVTSETSASLGIYVQDTDNDGTPDKVVDRDGADLSHLYTLKEDGIYEGEALLLPMAQTESYTPATESEAAPADETASSDATGENPATTTTGTQPAANSTAANNQTTATTQPNTNTGNTAQAQTQAPAQQQPQTPAQPQPTVHAPIYTQQWVVDQAAWTETVNTPVYETKEIAVCNNCGADITNNFIAHGKEHALKGEPGGYHSEVVQVETGTKTEYIQHKEVGHYESVLVCGGCTGTH